MEIFSKRIVDNIIKNAVNENDNSSKKIKSLHKKDFLSPSKIRRSERIAKKKILTINKYGKCENRRNRKTTKKPIWKINERFK